ncbi:hypothetical protein [Nioella nitratireducens]|uniref:hypothetical protein n=1 Tax=Nioella nitratireducens TaxID=1287720 RepID=UPI0008FD3D8F|nr:hypothetical protein [Nioella nitratireducens]
MQWINQRVEQDQHQDVAKWCKRATVEVLKSKPREPISDGLRIVPPDAGPFALDRSTLRITVLGDGRAVEMTGCHG